MAKTTNILLPDGSTLQVPAWASETTLVAMAQQMQRTNVLTSEMLDGVKEMADLDDETIKAIHNTIEATKTNAETDAKQSKQANRGLVGAVKAVNNTATFFGDSEKPMSSMVGALKNLSKNMDGPNGKGGLAKLTKALKIEGFMKKFGGAMGVAADVALAWAGWNAAKFEQFAEVQQKMIDSGSIFYDSADEFDNLYQRSFKSGVTYNAFADTISNYGATMTALGGNVSKGSKKFLGMFNHVQEVSSSMGDLGMQNAELMNQYAAYLEMARLTGQVDQRSMEHQGKQLAGSFADLVVESTALASLTKLNRNEALAAQLAAMSDVRLAAGTADLRRQGLGDQAATIENVQKQLSLISASATGQGKVAFDNLGEAINRATMQFSGNIENFTLEGILDTGTLAVMQTVAPGLIDTLTTQIREGTLSTKKGTETFLINEFAKVDTSKKFADATQGYGAEIQGFQGTILMLKKDMAGMIGKTEAQMKKIREETKKKLEASGTTVEAMNDAAKMFLTAQEAITMDLNGLSITVESLSEWFETNSTSVKNAVSKLFGDDAESTLSKSGNTGNLNQEKEGPDHKKRERSYEEKMRDSMNDNSFFPGGNVLNLPTDGVVVKPEINQNVTNRTNTNLNKSLTAHMEYVKMLEKNMTESKKAEVEMYKKQIEHIKTELKAREDKKMNDLKKQRDYFAR